MKSFNRLGVRLRKNYELYFFLLPALAYIVIFHYLPMYGVQIAFRDFAINKGISGSAWVGLKHIRRFISIPSFSKIVLNTLSLSVYSLAIGFPFPILLALLLNELRFKRFRKASETLLYLPHFMSTIVLVSLLNAFGNADYGILNAITGLFGAEPVNFLAVKNYFRELYVFSDVWQNAGWNSIIYLSALSAIDPQLHEAAMIDGASRIRRIWHINLPGIAPTLSILLILRIGSLMSVGFEKVFLMQNSLNLEVSEIISTYVYKVGLQQIQFSYSAAIGLFNSLVNFALLLTFNMVSKKCGGTALF